jgi:hypothetical protein
MEIDIIDQIGRREIFFEINRLQFLLHLKPALTIKTTRSRYLNSVSLAKHIPLKTQGRLIVLEQCLLGCNEPGYLQP